MGEGVAYPTHTCRCIIGLRKQVVCDPALGPGTPGIWPQSLIGGQNEGGNSGLNGRHATQSILRWILHGRALEEGRERALTSFQQECSSSEGGTEKEVGAGLPLKKALG